MKLKSLVMASIGLLVCAGSVFAGQAETNATQIKSATTASLSQDSKININRADAETLANLKGVGPKKGQAIVAYRAAHGDFKTLNDLANVKGFSDNTVEKLKSHLTVG